MSRFLLIAVLFLGCGPRGADDGPCRFTATATVNPPSSCLRLVDETGWLGCGRYVGLRVENGCTVPFHSGMTTVEPGTVGHLHVSFPDGGLRPIAGDIGGSPISITVSF